MHLQQKKTYDVPFKYKNYSSKQKHGKTSPKLLWQRKTVSILISVHANAYGDWKTFNSAKGVSTFCCSSPPAERKLAETIHNI